MYKSLKELAKEIRKELNEYLDKYIPRTEIDIYKQVVYFIKKDHALSAPKIYT